MFLPMKKIQGINVAHFSNGAHYEFHEYVLQMVKACSAITGETKYLTNLADEYEAALAVEKKYANVSLKSFKTDDIAAADQRRGAAYQAYKSVVEAHVSMNLPATYASALVLKHHLDVCKIQPRWQMDRETGAMDLFLAQVEETYATELSALGLGLYVQTMKEANTMLHEYMAARDLERSMAAPTGALRDARKATDEAYYQLIRYVNAFALVVDEEAYDSFIDIMNTIINRFKKNVLGISGVDTDDEEGEGTNEGENENPGDDEDDDGGNPGGNEPQGGNESGGGNSGGNTGGGSNDDLPMGS